MENDEVIKEISKDEAIKKLNKKYGYDKMKENNIDDLFTPIDKSVVEKIEKMLSVKSETARVKKAVWWLEIHTDEIAHIDEYEIKETSDSYYLHRHIKGQVRHGTNIGANSYNGSYSSIFFVRYEQVD